MTDEAPAKSARRHRVPIAVGAVVVVIAIVCHARLIAWFTGESTSELGEPTTTTAGTWTIATSIDPDPPREKSDRAHVEIHDPSGKPVDGADVTVTYDMPPMGAMQEMKGDIHAKPAGAGAYEAGFDLPMTGSYTLIVAANRGATSATARYTLTIGAKGLTSLGGEGASSGSGGDIAYYTCSMHPSVHAHEPGKCPVCSMELHPVTKADEQSGVVELDDARRAAIGVRTEKAVKAPMTVDIKAVGKLTYDESRLHDVVLKVGGYISDLRVTATGQPVTKGEPLFQIYSPDIYAAEQDFLLARQSRDALGKGDDLVRAAETKLTLLGLTTDQIAQLAKNGQPIEKLAFAAPASGYVIEKDVVDGAAVKAGDRIFRIAALDKIWVEADVFEPDLARIANGQTASIALSYVPGKTFDGKVTFIYPYLDPGTRTGRVRIELPNTGLELKPDMYADVMFHLDLGSRLQIPSSAILYAGPRKVVLVDLGGGKIAPREVQIGAQSGDRAEVVSGLTEGDAVVTSGNFLIAAESRIRASGTFWRDAK
jgi:Cu(I)/Ag(I) efflux system membrane fusion protein